MTTGRVRLIHAAMAFADFPDQKQAVDLLQRSLRRGRLGHAYLFSGQVMPQLEALARTLAKTLNCQHPVRAEASFARDGALPPAIDCCDTCPVCRKIDAFTHGDIHRARPESKMRQITIDQMREIMHEVHLRPNEAEYKVAIIEGADRLNNQAANSFLKTLEEPPAKSILILLTTEPQRILETIISRCLRLHFAAEGGRRAGAGQLEWLGEFGRMAVDQKSLISRYRLLDTLLQRLTELKEGIETSLAAKSPLERYDDVETNLKEKWEEELAAAVVAEYRLQRGELLLALQWWLRDVWLLSQSMGAELLSFPELPGAAEVARRITPLQAMENLEIIERTHRMLYTNVQEALALEVGLLKLHL